MLLKDFLFRLRVDFGELFFCFKRDLIFGMIEFLGFGRLKVKGGFLIYCVSMRLFFSRVISEKEEGDWVEVNFWVFLRRYFVIFK